MAGYETFGWYETAYYDQAQCALGTSAEQWLFDLKNDPNETTNLFGAADVDRTRQALVALASDALDHVYVPRHAYGTEDSDAGRAAVSETFQRNGGFVGPFGCALNHV